MLQSLKQPALPATKVWPASIFYSVNPAGEMVVFYYSRGPEVSPSASMWLVPGTAEVLS